MRNTAVYTTLHFILVKIIGDVLYFPVWWYSRGLVIIWQWFLRKLSNAAKRLALAIWLKHMFVPMYGQYNFWGRIISFWMRVVVLVLRLVVFICEFIFLATLIFIYLIILPGVVIMLIRSLI